MTLPSSEMPAYSPLLSEYVYIGAIAPGAAAKSASKALPTGPIACSQRKKEQK